MAITITSKYTPLSYEQKIAPLVAYKEEYDSMMDKYDQLENEASKLAYIAQQYPESEAANAYNQYISDLDAMATEMSQGLSPGYRRKYSDIYKQYHRKITPMQQAHETILKNIENERALQAADNTRISTFSPQNIDDIIKGVQPGQTIAVSGAKLTEEAANLATIYGKALKDISIDETAFTRIANLNPVYRTDANGNIMYDANGYPIIENLSKDSYRNEARFLMSEISNGLDPNTFSELISNVNNLKTEMPALYSMVESIRTSNNYKAFNNEQKKQFDARIAQGLYSALQEPSYQLHNNPDFMGYGQPELIEEQIMNYSRANKPKGASTSSSSSNGSSTARRIQTYDKPMEIEGTGSNKTVKELRTGDTSENIEFTNSSPINLRGTADNPTITITIDGIESEIATIVKEGDYYKVIINESLNNDDNKKTYDFYKTTLTETLEKIIKDEGVKGLNNYNISTNSPSKSFRKNKVLYIQPKAQRMPLNSEVTSISNNNNNIDLDVH